MIRHFVEFGKAGEAGVYGVGQGFCHFYAVLGPEVIDRKALVFAVADSFDSADEAMAV